MFNLLMNGHGWEPSRSSISLDRLFEHTDDGLRRQFRSGEGQPDLEALQRLPCLFMAEGRKDQIARVGSITRPRVSGREIVFDVHFDPGVPPLLNRTIFEHRVAFDMANEFEFNRNHWAVKDVDLFRELFRFAPPRRQLPKVFTIRDHPLIEDDLVSVMMPFDAGFTPVFKAIRDAVDEADLRCLRVDDLWEADAIIDDVVSLIDRSRVVICDCTGRNANVFYEAGIAHTLGRPVVLLTQRSEDIPFDLRHIRYIEYLKNEEGLKDMAAALSDRLKTIKDREV